MRVFQYNLLYNQLPPRENAFLENNDVIIPSGVTFPQYLDDDIRLTFNLGKSDLYLDPLHSSYHLQFQMVLSDGEAFPGGGLMGVLANFLYTSISRVEIWANGQVLKTYNNFPFIIQPVMLCELDKNYIDTVLGPTAAFWRDEAPANDQTFQSNRGLAKRRELCQGSRKVPLEGQILFVPFFQTENLLPMHCNWQIVITMVKRDFGVLYTNKPIKPPPDEPEYAKYKVELQNAYLTINHVKLSEVGERQVQAQID